MLSFPMFLGGSIFVSAANNLMDDDQVRLLRQITDINTQEIIEAGTTGFRGSLQQCWDS